MHRPIILLFAFVASSTLASPALQPDDVGLRHDIQVLADYGVIRGPVTTWPLSWDAIAADLGAARDADIIVPPSEEFTQYQHGYLTIIDNPSPDYYREQLVAATAGN